MQLRHRVLSEAFAAPAHQRAQLSGVATWQQHAFNREVDHVARTDSRGGRVAAAQAATHGRRGIVAASSIRHEQQQVAAVCPTRGDIVELECSSLAFGGEGLCKLPGGLVVFVDRALPGERLRARVVQAKRSWAKAEKIETLRPHSDAAAPACVHFGPCGGCSWQNLAYPAQLAAKQQQLAELASRLAGVPDVASILRPMVPCGQPYGYRNKLEFSFSNQTWDPRASSGSGSGTRPSVSSSAPRRGAGASASARFALGFHRPASHTQVLPISACALQPDPGNAILQAVRELCERQGLRPYDPATRSGLLQHVVIRSASGGGAATPQVGSSAASNSTTLGSGGGGSATQGGPAPPLSFMVNVVTSRDAREELRPLVQDLVRTQLPHGATLASVVNSVSARGRGAGARGVVREHVLHGSAHLVERLCGMDFRVSPNSFFQTNTRQAEALYTLVQQAAGLRPGDTLLDLFCGTGTIGLCLAAQCRAVVGIELSPAAVADARANAELNAIPHARFIQGDLAQLELAELVPQADVIVVDPARAGLPPAVVAFLQRSAARRLVYVSCNPATQARDMRALCHAPGARYRVASLQAVDLYPQTPHVETVAVLDAV